MSTHRSKSPPVGPNRPRAASHRPESSPIALNRPQEPPSLPVGPNRPQSHSMPPIPAPLPPIVPNRPNRPNRQTCLMIAFRHTCRDRCRHSCIIFSHATLADKRARISYADFTSHDLFTFYWGIGPNPSCCRQTPLAKKNRQTPLQYFFRQTPSPGEKLFARLSPVA